jgi:hypothetical protein
MFINRSTLLSALAALCTFFSSRADTTTAGSAAQDLPHVLPFEVGDSEFVPGDSITVQEITGTSKDIRVGGTYCVTGSYTLNSQDSADLSFFATTTNTASSPIDAQQTTRITKGTGSFRLVKLMTDDGYLHVTFYSHGTGQGFGGVYFGQGEGVLRDKHFSYLTSAAHPEKPVILKEASFNGPNNVLFSYLGEPVAPPTNMDASYSKEGLTAAMQAAAQKAGVLLKKLEIDDSEFPCLVGVVFAKNGDKEKFKDQIRNLPAYSITGGVGGETVYSMNIVPYRAFPADSGQRIYRRLMLRESVLFDKISAQP